VQPGPNGTTPWLFCVQPLVSRKGPNKRTLSHGPEFFALSNSPFHIVFLRVFVSVMAKVALKLKLRAAQTFCTC
jgi:hypothetical protein